MRTPMHYNILITCFQVYPFVLDAVVASSGMDKNAAYVFMRRTLGRFPCERFDLCSAVDGHVLGRRPRHVLGLDRTTSV
jgi:hypothetical protein